MAVKRYSGSSTVNSQGYLTTNVTISSVDLSRAYVIPGGVANLQSTSSYDNYAQYELTTATNVQLRLGGYANALVYWSFAVVEEPVASNSGRTS